VRILRRFPQGLDHVDRRRQVWGRPPPARSRRSGRPLGRDLPVELGEQVRSGRFWTRGSPHDVRAVASSHAGSTSPSNTAHPSSERRGPSSRPLHEEPAAREPDGGRPAAPAPAREATRAAHPPSHRPWVRPDPRSPTASGWSRPWTGKLGVGPVGGTRGGARPIRPAPARRGRRVDLRLEDSTRCRCPWTPRSPG